MLFCLAKHLKTGVLPKFLWALLFTSSYLLLTSCTTLEPLPTRAVLENIVAVETSTTLPPTRTPAQQTVTAPQPQSTASATAVSPTATPSPLPTPIQYIVQPGDTLLSIADAHEVALDLLLQVNNLGLDDLIFPNDIINIPPQVANDIALPVHFVKPGETFASIAAQYGLELERLLQTNASLSPDALLPGQAVLLPIAGEYHFTVPGDTLLALVFLYDVSLDSLLSANLDTLDPANPDFVPVGVLLKVPQEQISEGYDCTPLPPRTAVTTYTTQNDEQLFCLSNKFSVDITTLYEANPTLRNSSTIENGTTILIPPANGALYEITAEDEANNVRLQDILAWYGITRFDDIVTWENTAVSDPLQSGEKLFINHADLMAGPFTVSESLVTIAPANETAVAVAPPPPITSAEPSGSSPTAVAIAPPSPTGDPPPGAIRPKSNPWTGEMTEYDTGYCGAITDGSGWTGSLIWPVDSRTIEENRGFRPGHGAIDIVSPLGAPIYAAESGLVVWAGFSRWGGGNMIVLAHGNTRQTHYAHLADVNVGCGQFVNKGDVIGSVGQTGSSTFPHLHFLVRYDGYNYDPFTWLP